jgi:phosphate/sulfate permease
MVLSFKKTTSPSSTSANVVDGYLILSLLNAQEPKIWRMALEKIGTASFEIKQEKDSTVTKLILKPKKGAAEIIASFDINEKAIEALTLAANALQHKETAPSKLDSITTNQDNAISSESPKWVIVLLGLFIVIGLYYYLTTLIPEKNIGFDLGTTSQINKLSPQEATGVPVSADDFLNGL